MIKQPEEPSFEVLAAAYQTLDPNFELVGDWEFVSGQLKALAVRRDDPAVELLDMGIGPHSQY